MRFFGISDLHLSLNSNKPMDRFGEHWYKHHEKVAENWRGMVTEDDVVLIPGDHSWALHLEDAREDLAWIAALPGKKIMGKGNHDLWWHSPSKLRALALPGMHWLQNTALIIDNVGIGGSRGWALPGLEPTPQDEKIYLREQERLRLSFQDLRKQARGQSLKAILCMLHYPPLLCREPRDSEFTRMLEEAGVTLCVYGHMHLSHGNRVFRGTHNGVAYEVVSCDFTRFAPRLLLDTSAPESPHPGEGDEALPEIPASAGPASEGSLQEAGPSLDDANGRPEQDL